MLIHTTKAGKKFRLPFMNEQMMNLMGWFVTVRLAEAQIELFLRPAILLLAKAALIFLHRMGY